MLRAAGCAYEPEQIGISRERLRAGYGLAYLIRRRFTVLDFAERWGLTEAALDHLFGPDGPWPLDGNGRPPGQTQATTESAADRH